MKPVDHAESPFAELDLNELWGGTGKTRVRQHVNPLRLEYQHPVGPLDWPALFSDPTNPLFLDLGCGYGRFLLLLQRRNPQQDINYLGIEIRKPLVERANEWAERLGVQDRVAFVFGNATVSLGALLATYPGPVTGAAIQYPDPHFKRRHHKRRIFQPSLVWAVRDLMVPGGQLLLQSDIEEVSAAMRNIFEKYAGDAFEPAPQHCEGAVFFSGGRQGRPPEAAGAASIPLAADHADRNSASSSPQPAPQHWGFAAEQARTAAARQMLADHPDHHTATATTTNNNSSAGSGAFEGLSPPLDLSQAPPLDPSQTLPQQPPTHSSHPAESYDSDGASSDDGGGERAAGDAGAGSAGRGGGGDAHGSEADDDYESLDSQWSRRGWLLQNPLGTPTEREHYVLQQGLPVYRVLLVRK